MRRAALTVLALLALAGCSGGQPALDNSTASTTPVATTAASPEDMYVNGILNTPGLTTDMARAEMIGIGRSICDAIGVEGISRELLVSSIGTTRFGPEVAALFVRNSQTFLCPERQYATLAAPTTTTPAGPRTVFTTGTYEVGVDIRPGRYRSPGGTGCYWARLDEDQEITDNNLSDGPTVFDVRESDEFVELNRCTWTMSE